MIRRKTKMHPPKRTYVKSKKGVSLLELIVAVIILCIIVSATVTGLAMSYRSILVGAEKDNMSSIAQKNCDIVMAVIENGEEASVLEEIETGINMYKLTVNVKQYTEIRREGDILYADQALPIKNIDAVDVVQEKGKAYYTIAKKKNLKDGVEYALYVVDTYVYYTDENYVTCTGSVTKQSVPPAPII